MLRAAANIFCEAGLPIHLPQDGDLDDVERERYETLRAALSAALAAAWRPINEADKDGMRVSSKTFILAHAEKKWIRFGKWYVQEGCWYYSGTSERSQWAQVRGDAPTHFMPLPSPPKAGGE